MRMARLPHPTNRATETSVVKHLNMAVTSALFGMGFSPAWQIAGWRVGAARGGADPLKFVVRDGAPIIETRRS